MNLFNIINTIKSTCISYKGVQEFNYGDIYEFENSKMRKYVNMNFTLQNLSNDVDSDGMIVNGVLFCVDRMTDNGDNKLMVQSNCTDILKKVLVRLTENNLSWTLSGETYEVFSEKFADLCAGAWVTFSIEVGEDIICSDDEFVVKTLDVTKNGLYDVVGYDRILVNINPVLNKISITENGTYKPDKGVDGFDEVEVNVVPKIKLVDGTKLGQSTWSKLPDYDFSDITDYKQMFNQTNLTEIDFKNINIRGNCDSLMFWNTKLTKIDNIDLQQVTNLNQAFSYDSELTEINGILNAFICEDINYIFNECRSLTKIDISAEYALNMNKAFYNCYRLTDIGVMNCTRIISCSSAFDELTSITNVGGFINLGANFNSTKTVDFHSWGTNITVQSIQNIIDTIANITNSILAPGSTLKFSTDMYNKCTDDMKQQIANKGWTLAY